jgi:hypothetical protein
MATDKVNPVIGLINSPSMVNYGRVVLDIMMTILLILVVVSDVATNSKDAAKALHVHEMPIYVKKDMDFGTMWKDSGVEDDSSKLSVFHADVLIKCQPIILHPMCVCLMTPGNSVIQTKNCLLQHPTPSVISDWNIGTVSSAMILWFLASLATSVGTLPFINTFVSSDSGVESHQHGVMVVNWSRKIGVSYVILTLCAIFAPMITLGIQFPASGKHMEGLLNILIWSMCAFIALASYNHKTLIEFFTYALVENKLTTVENNVNQKNMSIGNYILYVHLLISAPAIAVILHLTQVSTDYNVIINTTLILSVIFATDAFSVEMANYWSHHATHVNIEKLAVTDDARQILQDTHTRLGLIRLFAWVVNCVMLLLLLTLAYPVAVESQQVNSAMFVVLVVVFGTIFLVPDLVREFTQSVSFNSIQFRLYGDFILRSLVLFWIYRAESSNRS